MDLTQKKCAPCEGGVPKLEGAELEKYLGEIESWELREGKIHKGFACKDFKEAMAFLNRVAEVAEAEGHHPDFRLYSWNRIEITLSTHAIGGLSENDFILAAKIDALAGGHR